MPVAITLADNIDAHRACWWTLNGSQVLQGCQRFNAAIPALLPTRGHATFCASAAGLLPCCFGYQPLVTMHWHPFVRQSHSTLLCQGRLALVAARRVPLITVSELLEQASATLNVPLRSSPLAPFSRGSKSLSRSRSSSRSLSFMSLSRSTGLRVRSRRLSPSRSRPPRSRLSSSS